MFFFSLIIIPVLAKLNLQQPLLQISASSDPSEMNNADAQETFIIIRKAA